MDLIDFMAIISFIGISSVCYILIFNEKVFKKKNGHYTVPGWNFLLKKWWAEREVHNIKCDQVHLLKELKNYKSEEPKILKSENSSDSQLIYGSDQNGNSLLLKLTRRRHRLAEIWLILRLKNGKIYTLPNHPDTRVSNATPRFFEASGLRFECLAPFSRWRITFSGQLRQGTRENWSEDVKETELKFIKFNFIWSADSNPLHWPYDWSAKLMATSLASEPWRDGKWMFMLSKADSGGYDQFGALKGQVFVQNEDNPKNEIPKMDIFEMNLPGLRQRRWGLHKAMHLHRTGSIIGVCHDGSVYLIGAVSSKRGLTHSQFGHIRKPNGDVHAIDWMDFHLSTLAETPDNIPNARIVRFLVGKKSYTTTIHFCSAKKVNLVGGRPFDWSANNIPLELGLNGGRGVGIAMLWYPFQPKNSIHQIPSDGPRIQSLFYRDIKSERDQLTVTFNQIEAQSIYVSGGKGASIALLTSINNNKSNSKRDNFNIQALIEIPARANNLKQRLLKVDDKSKSDWNLTELKKEVITGYNERDSLMNWKPKKELKCPEFIVPDGFILSVSAFELHLEKNPNIVCAIKNLEDIAYGKIEGNLENACENVMKKFINSQLDLEVQVAIVLSLQNLRECDTDSFIAKGEFELVQKASHNLKMVAVRSSAIDEDGSDASSAGQNETFLGLRTKDEVLEAVKKCWASLYKYQSVQYRIQHILPIKTEMGVVVQVMVDADSAGVLFTKHPSTGDPNKILITANYGLGESIVAGEVDVDVFIVKRSFNDKLNLFSTKVGKKSHKISLGKIEISGENIEKIEINENDQNELCLSTEIILKLAEIGIVLEKMYGTYCDIEWAISNNQIYLLQSRPITSLKNLSEWELLHEFDSAIMSEDDLQTIANVGEVFPGASTPLTHSIILKSIDIGIHADRPNNISDKLHSGLFFSAMHLSHHHVMMNVYKTILPIVNKKITLAEKIQGLSIFGHEFLTPEIHKIACHRNEIINTSRKFYILLDMITCMWNNADVTKKITNFVKNFRGKYFMENLIKYKSSNDLLISLEETIGKLTNITRMHTHTSKVCTFYQLITMMIVVEGNDNISIEHNSDIACLLGTCKENISGDIPFSLKSICKKIFETGLHEKFVEINLSEAEKWLEQNCKDAFVLFQQFISKHYHRSIKEFDLSSETWGMNNECIIEMLQTILSRVDPTTSFNQEIVENRSDQEILKNLKTPKKMTTRKLLGKLLPLCQISVQRREITKSNVIAYIHELRMAFLYIGRLMRSEGYLPDVDLIFYLTLNEIDEVLISRNSSLITKALRRRKNFKKWEDIKFPELIFGIPKPIDEDQDNDDMIDESNVDVKVKGTPVCAGSITGRACVIYNIKEASQILAGDILITQSTDIGWSPYFPILGGVVTELGGLISHGAVVAREYGLPCIVAASGASKKFKTGDIVRLSGDKGIIVKIKL